MMNSSLTLAFVVFAIVTLYTPGPNNVMLMTSGLNFGVQRTMPHVLGVSLGFSLMLAATGLGLGAVFTALPGLQSGLKYVGAAYLLYLAFAIARSKPADPKEAERGKPMTFLGAALFQWVNAKAWVIALGTMTAYAGVAQYPWNIALQTVVMAVIGFTSALAWAAFGSWLKVLIKSARAARNFNLVMAVLLVASLYPVLMGP